MTGHETLNRLKEGNHRFVSGRTVFGSGIGDQRRESVAAGQDPFAVVLGCSDSRVPPELVFDQGLGDLFVIRVAGNVAGPAEIASIEFAVQWFGLSLVVVLGHSNCGAVTAALEVIAGSPAPSSPHSAAVLDPVISRVAPLVAEPIADRPAPELMERAVRANAESVAMSLVQQSEYLSSAVGGGLLIVGAEYSLETGMVRFY